MSDVRELYQEMIIDHGRHPRHFGKLENFTHHKEGYNPLCGDKLTVYVIVEAGAIKEAVFEGVGCAISMASASIMLQLIQGKSLAEVEKYFNEFHDLVTNRDSEINKESLGKLAVLAGVRDYPARVKCATLAWHTLMAALRKESQSISTESL